MTPSTSTIQRIPYSSPLETFINALKNDGCVIVQDFTTHEALNQARSEVQPYLDAAAGHKNSQLGGKQQWVTYHMYSTSIIYI